MDPVRRDEILVLVVDEARLALPVANLLTDCGYRQPDMRHGRFAALNLLQQNRQRYDMALVNVEMLYDGEGELLSFLQRRLRIPVIMLDSAENIDVINRAVDDGVCDYMIHPVSRNEIAKLWVHVKRQRQRGRRTRFIWTEAHHDAFLGAIQRLGGIDRATPKRILEIIPGIPGLSRQIVASHLRRLRLEDRIRARNAGPN